MHNGKGGDGGSILCLLLHMNTSLSDRMEIAKISNIVVYGVGVGVCESVSVFS